MKTRYMNLIFTNHAISRLHNRGISQSDAWYVFSHPDGSLPGKIPNSQKFYKEYQGQRIEVIAKKSEKGEWLILSAWAKKPGHHQPIFSQNENLFQKIIGKLVRKIFKPSPA